MQPFKIMGISDIHERLEYLQPLAAVFAAADLVLILGDLTQFGHRQQAAHVLASIRQANPRVLAVPGNLDHPDVQDYLGEEGVSIHGTQRMAGEIGIAGVGGSSPTPFHTPFEFSEESLADLLAPALAAIAGARWRIAVSHTPPHRTRVDRVRFGLHAGSSAIRRLVLEHQPHLLLSGHIHEAAGEDRLGETRLLNPGPFYRGGYVWIEASAESLAAEIRRP